MAKTRTTVLAGLALLILGACEGSSGKPASSGSTGPVVFEAFPVSVAEVLCGKVFGCCSATQRQGTENLVGTNEDECRALLVSGLSQSLPAIQASIAQGRLAFDGALLRACVTKGLTQSCAEVEKAGSPLKDCVYLVPKVAVGGTCENNAECVGGFCDGLSAITPGTCAALKAMGASCQTDEECASDWCDFENTSTCIAAPMTTSFCG